MFKSLDRDGDQRLSKSEVAKNKTLMDDFAALDGDGYRANTLRTRRR